MNQCECPITENGKTFACSAVISDKVAEFSKDVYGRYVCYECQTGNEEAEKLRLEVVKSKAKMPSYKVLGNKSKSENWQEDMIDFETLMTKAHEQGLESIETEMLQIDLSKKYALFKATVKGKKHIDNNTYKVMTLQGHGDATEENITGEFIKPHFIRMAETRAIVRALRWYTNNAGKAAEEEK